MVDAHDSKSCLARGGGSSPLSGTMKAKVLVIVGPTASGKSALAVKLAKKLKGEVISADSRQVYRGLNIGAGKITKKEMQGVPHHLLDVANPKKVFTASDYQKLALEKLRSVNKRGRLPIIVGGTGFYIDTVTCGILYPEVPPNKKLREKLSKLSVEKLFSMLEAKDKERAALIDKKNKVRLVRALEIIDSLGSVPKARREESEYQFVFIGLKPEDLEIKIEKRLAERLPKIILEVKKLYKEGLSWKRMFELGLEYRYVSLYVRGKISKDEMKSVLLKEIKKYAKRQMTWFKRNKEITWLPLGGSASLATILKLLG